MHELTTPFLTGTATGAILLLAALGLTLTFGQMGVINMANGEFLMAGAYVAYLTQQVVSAAGLSIVIALPAAFVVAGLLGLLLELSIIQWMYQRPLDTTPRRRTGCKTSPPPSSPARQRAPSCCSPHSVSLSPSGRWV